MSYLFSGTGFLRNAERGPVPAGTSFTVAVWWRAVDATPSVQQSLFGAASTANYGRTCYMSVTGINGLPRTVAADGQTEVIVASGPATTNNGWHLYVGAWTAASETVISDLRTYGFNQTENIDNGGFEVLDTSALLNGMFPLGTMSIGARPNSATTMAPFFNGDIAQVGIWNKVLSNSELLALRTQAAPYVEPARCVAYWPLLENANAHPEFGGVDYSMTVNGDATLNEGVGPAITLYGGGSRNAPRARYYQMLRGA